MTTRADIKMKASKMEQPKILISIVERGKGKAIIHLYNKEGVNYHYQTIGHGTATSEIMDILGLDSKDKDIIISLSTKSMINALIYKMSDELRGVVDTRGILFDLPVTGITNLIAAAFNIQLGVPMEKRNTQHGTSSEEDKEKEGNKNMTSEQKYSLVLISVNQGYTEEVLDTARAKGARGGTVFRARFSGDKAFEQQGIHLQAEKEIIAIVVPNDIRNSIMDEINAAYGMTSEAEAVVLSMKVDHFAPI